jgi:hypothetical protein
MIFKKSQSLYTFQKRIQARTLMVFCNDCLCKDALDPVDHIKTYTQTGLEFIDADQENLKSLRDIIRKESIEQIILVGHYPCMIHTHLTKNFLPTSRWKNAAQRTKQNFLKLEEDGIRLVSDKEFAGIHLKQQLAYFQKLIVKLLDEKENIPIVRGLLADREDRVMEVEVLDYQLHHN